MTSTCHPQRDHPTIRIGSTQDFVSLLRELSSIDSDPSATVLAEVDRLLAAVGTLTDVPRRQVESHFFGQINFKLRLNQPVLAEVYRRAAHRGVVFNYHAKKAISWAVNSGDLDAFTVALEQYCPDDSLRVALTEDFGGASPDDTRTALVDEIYKPTKLRKALARDVAVDVIDAAAGCLVWAAWPTVELRRCFDTFGDEHALEDDFLLGLRRRNPSLFERDRSLVLRRITDADFGEAYDVSRDRLCAWLANEYDALDNHGHLVVVVPTDGSVGQRAWELAADLTLFGERFAQYELKLGYYRPKAVEEQTCEYLPDIDRGKADFKLGVEGYTYRDLFVLHDEAGVVERLVLLFQRNRRDETLIPCPACRSTRVAGNSYPSFGVKSWECRNPLCPERSIYNRGKRYQFKHLLTQEAIENPANAIPVESVRRWRRDVLRFVSDEDIVEWAIRHYSMESDVVVLMELEQGPDSFERIVKVEAAPELEPASSFWSSAFFHRYVPTNEPVREGSDWIDDEWKVIEGDSTQVLAQWAENSVERAVTSPPYFNAREYSQWPNLYCYLHDMAVLHQQVFRVLRPGAVYAFNVFDYFDNERIITYSLMGQKRLSLSSLFVDLFRRIGFELVGNAVWDKGDVEGKRSFNAGNFSPFYQSPLNCWEHVLFFRKPGGDGELDQGLPLNRVLKIKPVVKMVRGENRHGHTAPFPMELPAACLTGLPLGLLVLDPFGGSGTTVRASLDAGLWGVAIEQSPEYCGLAERLTREHLVALEAEQSRISLF